MCGISGFSVIPNTQINYSDVILNMNTALAHRGPDASGVWNDESVYLGHVRLAIIDLQSSSNQPLHSSDNRYVIVYNGELYNYLDLKLELQRVAQGSNDLPYFFKTNSDTEVVIAAYQRWGSDCLHKFNGMFAFALYDKHEKKMFVARDRMGIKPLYYSYKNKQLIFSSEIRALLSTPFIEKKINRNIISEYVLYQTVHAPNTIIEDVNTLMPGHYMEFHNNALNIKQYWNINSYTKPSNNLNYKATCSRIEELLFQSVERRLISDVAFGAFLSGGIDSSAIVGIMSKISSKKVETFNVSFDESSFSEADYARKISRLFNTNHHEIKLSPDDFLNLLPEALNAMDHPSGDGPNTYVVSKATKQAGITMALSGLGGDELFAGYDVFKQMHKINNKAWLNVFPSWMRKIPAEFIKAKKNSIAGDKIHEILSGDKISIEYTYPIFRKLYSQKQTQLLLKTKHNQKIQEIIKSISFPDNQHVLSYVSALEINTYMQNILLRDADQMSMAVALEVRVPFLDYKLTEFVLSVNDEFKYPSSPKKLLIDSLNGLLPDEIINRPKMGFTLPWQYWLKNELRFFCEQNIKALAKRDFINKQELENLWNGFLNNEKKITWSRIWHLIVLENWLQKNNIN